MKLEKEKFKVGWGNAALMLRVDTKDDPNVEFPDGCKPELTYEKGGLVLRLLNRKSGVKWSQKKIPGSNKLRNSWQLTLHARNLGADVERFGAVSPDSVERMVGGFILRLPTNRPPVMGRKTVKPLPPQNQHQKVVPPAETEVAQEPAAVEEPVEQEVLSDLVELSPEAQSQLARMSQAPALMPVQSAVPEERPSSDLLAAVEALNQWKRFLGDKLAVTLNQSGRVAIMVEYGEL